MGKKSIIIGTDDLPSYKEIVDATSRLRKDHKLLTKIRGNKDQESPESMKAVAAFLEMLAKREKRNLPKDDSVFDNSHDILMQMLYDELKDMETEEVHKALARTDLGKIFNKGAFCD